MRKMRFDKYQASGNDFVVIDSNSSDVNFGLADFAKRVCHRKTGIGADGLLVLGKSKVADIKMRIFNADGSEAEMCGNGARCAAYWAVLPKKKKTGYIKIETKSGVIESQVRDNTIKIKLTDPPIMRLGVPLKVGKLKFCVGFINTGVPHTVLFVDNLERIDLVGLGRKIRYHKEFAPKGTNVNFVKLLDNNSIRVRTYERGVEDETLACGTGSTASAIIARLALKKPRPSNIVNVHTRSGEVLKVYFKHDGYRICEVYLEGKAHKVFSGEISI